MQPFVPADCVQVEMVYNWQGQRVQNVLHYAFSGAPLPADMTELAQDIITAWTTHFDSLMPTTLSFIEVKVTDLRTQISPSIIDATGLPNAGSNAGESLPNNVAVVITKRTAFRGRSYRGRIFHAGLVENQVANNVVSPSHLTNILNAWNNFLAFTGTTVNWELVVLSRYQAGAWLTQGIVTPVTNLTSDGVIDSQRRRLPGRGS